MQLRTFVVRAAIASALALLAGAPVAQAPAPAASTRPGAAPAAPALPPLPEGVAELKFHEVFAPIGPRGLEYSARAKELDGRRVRILGYMVKTCRHDHGRFLLAPMPVTLHDHEMGPADDLPPATVFVDVPPLRRALKFVPWEPGLFLLTGTLRLGGRDELHGRRSWVRLELERPEAAATATATAPASGATPAAPRTDVRAVDTAPDTTPTPRAADDAPAAASPTPTTPRPTPKTTNQR